jgi:hypothetical protein
VTAAISGIAGAFPFDEQEMTEATRKTAAGEGLLSMTEFAQTVTQ